MMKLFLKFEVESVTEILNHGVVVFARKLEKGDFPLADNIFLNECEVKSCDIPRKIDVNGDPRLDLWGFILVNKKHPSKFEAGDKVDLTWKT